MLVLGICWGAIAYAKPQRTSLEIHTTATSYQFLVELANTPNRQRNILAYRGQLRPHHAVLYDYYGQKRPTEFSMRDVSIPLDLIFINWKGEVVGTYKRALPKVGKPIPVPKKTTFILATKLGSIKRVGAREGSEVHHPSITVSANNPPPDAERSILLFVDWMKDFGEEVVEELAESN